MSESNNVVTKMMDMSKGCAGLLSKYGAFISMHNLKGSITALRT